jgi:O-antigen/teichoic acid export membrane protein
VIRRPLTLLQRAFVLRSEGLGRRVVTGASFQFAGMMLRTVVSLGSTAALARLLVPADFGYVAMAMVVTELAALFANFGFTNLLIQRRTISRLHLDTVFWASVLLGTFLTLAVFLMSFLSEALFSDPRVGELLRVLCLTFTISSLGTIPTAVLWRLMRFKTDFWIQSVTVVSRAIVAIGLAWAGFGVWSLVAAALLGTAVQTALSLWAVPYFPRFRFHLRFLSSTWVTSGSYFGGGLLFYANMNVDLMLIGRQLGATSLGYYQSARALTDEIRSRMAVPLQHVLFPAISTLQNERQRMQSLVVRSGRLLAAVVIPVGVGASAVAPELVLVLYGQQWAPMIPLMSMFGLSAALKASTAIAVPIFNACNRVELGLKFGALGTALLVLGIWISAARGIEAVAFAVVLVSLYGLVPFVVALRLIGLGLRQAWQILGPPALASSVMWLGVTALRGLSSEWMSSNAGSLILHVGVGALVYPAVLHLLSRQYVQEFRDVAGRILSRQ